MQPAAAAYTDPTVQTSLQVSRSPNMLRLPHALAAFYGAQLQHVSSLTLQHLLGASANGISITYGTSELAAATTAARPRCCCCSRRSFGTGSLPPNAMDLIKELRKNSGAPIADVKVREVQPVCWGFHTLRRMLPPKQRLYSLYLCSREYHTAICDEMYGNSKSERKMQANLQHTI